MDLAAIKEMKVREITLPDCAVFLWCIWSMLPEALEVIAAWGFQYKTLGFNWTKTDPRLAMGYWTRQDSEGCMLATRGHPRRLRADVRQGIREPRRRHSEKPVCIHERIESL
jgi:N6-adenosine-specific RNA methylase IME4